MEVNHEKLNKTYINSYWSYAPKLKTTQQKLDRAVIDLGLHHPETIRLSKIRNEEINIEQRRRLKG